jgi:hypothetical protein
MDLMNYYKLNFSLQQFQQWPIPMVENMTPYDRDIYVQLLSQHIEEEKAKQNQS